MKNMLKDRRNFLKQAGLVGSLAMIPEGAGATIGLGGNFRHLSEYAVLPQQSDEQPKYHIKFAVCGMSHDHIYGMVGAIQRGGGELVAAWGWRGG
jgi:hypothetical protein